MRFHSRDDGAWWLNIFGLHFSGQLCRWRGGPGFDLTWGTGYAEGIGISLRCVVGFWLTWKMPWRLMKRIPWWPMDGDREIGVSWIGDWARVYFARDPMGAHYGYRKGRLTWLWRVWKNREIVIWRNTWVVGRDRVETRLIDQREAVIDCGRWPGDSYLATQKIERMTWRNRFRTKTHVGYWWNLPLGQRGIPTSPHGKWGDRYDETYGFGASAPDTDDVAVLLEAQPVALAARLELLLRDWPEGMIAEYEEVTP